MTDFFWWRALRLLVGLFLAAELIILWSDIGDIMSRLIDGRMKLDDLLFALRQLNVFIPLVLKLILIGGALTFFGWIRYRINRVHHAVHGVPHPALTDWWGL